MVAKVNGQHSSSYKMERKKFLYILMAHQEQSLTQLLDALTREFGELNAPKKGRNKARAKPLAPTLADVKVHLARARAAFSKDCPGMSLALRIPKEKFDWSPFPSVPIARRNRK